jgi:hypothetical protein
MESALIGGPRAANAHDAHSILHDENTTIDPSSRRIRLFPSIAVIGGLLCDVIWQAFCLQQIAATLPNMFWQSSSPFLR